MAKSSLALSAQEKSPEMVECFRHEGEYCPRCDGSGFRPAKRCAGFGEAAGSVSEESYSHSWIQVSEKTSSRQFVNRGSSLFK
jgi:hypothetical protein